MKFWIAVIAFFALWGAIAVGRAKRARQRREQALSRTFPGEWETALERGLALYRRLPQQLRVRLHKKILLFLDEKRFEGCGGLEVTDDMRLTIAAQACLLIMNAPDHSPPFPALSSILLYPDAYLAPEYIPLDDDLYVETTGLQSGESWQEGTVILSWRDVKRESRDARRPYNVVIHEFAHQLDQESGWADGTPILRNRGHYDSWQSVFKREFLKLREEGGSRDSPLDEYGGLDPAEFFAVATETFFQAPRRMAGGIPELYELLRDYFGLDPAAWKEPAALSGAERAERAGER